MISLQQWALQGVILPNLTEISSSSHISHPLTFQPPHNALPSIVGVKGSKRVSFSSYLPLPPTFQAPCNDLSSVFPAIITLPLTKAHPLHSSLLLISFPPFSRRRSGQLHRKVDPPLGEGRHHHWRRQLRVPGHPAQVMEGREQEKKRQGRGD